MFSTLRNRIATNKRGAALVLTFALVITGSGLSSLASLSDTLHDTVTFQTLNVSLTDGGAPSAAITFSGINPELGGSYSQTINLTNDGNASATVSVNGIVTTGAGSDLDAAITVAAYDGVNRIGTAGLWPSISGLGANVGTFALTAGQSRVITLNFAVAPHAGNTSSLIADVQFVAVHP